MDTKTQPAETPIVESELYRITERSLRAARLEDDCFVRPRAAGSFDIAVGPASVDRALAILRSLLAKAGDAGVRFSIERKDRRTVALVGGQELTVRLTERRKRVPHRITPEERAQYPKPASRAFFLPKWDYLPTGELMLWADEPSASNLRRRWADTGSLPLEQRIDRFLAGLPKIVEAARQVAIERDRQAREWAEQSRRAAEEEHRRAEERHRRQLLLEEAAAWQQSQNLRSYIEGIRARFHLQRDPDQQARRDRWLSWASSVADSMDPVLQAEATTTERAMPGPEHGRGGSR